MTRTVPPAPLGTIVQTLDEMGITREQLCNALDYKRPQSLDRAIVEGTTHFHGIRKQRVHGLYHLLDSGTPKPMVEGIMDAWARSPIALDREYNGHAIPEPEPEPEDTTDAIIMRGIPEVVPIRLSWSGHAPAVTVVVSLEELAFIQSHGWNLNTEAGRQWMDDVELLSRPRLPQIPEVVVYD